MCGLVNKSLVLDKHSGHIFKNILLFYSFYCNLLHIWNSLLSVNIRYKTCSSETYRGEHREGTLLGKGLTITLALQCPVFIYVNFY